VTRLRRASLFFLVATLAHAQLAAADGARTQTLTAGQAQLKERQAALQRQVTRPRKVATQATLTGLKGRGAQAQKLSFPGDDGGAERLLLRVPGRGTSWGTRANEAVGMLASQLGEPHWVPAGIDVEATTFHGINGVLSDTGRKAQSDKGHLMVVEFVGSGFKDGEEAPVAWLRAVPEAARVKAAVIDALSIARDRKLANVMVNESGDLRLIDHDITFGQKSEKGPHFASSFWKGQAIGYTSRQARFEDLPASVQKVVRAIAEEDDLDALRKVFPISRQDRLPWMRNMAKAIVQHGLDAAVKAVVDESTQKGFTHVDDTPNAVTLRNGR